MNIIRSGLLRNVVINNSYFDFTALPTPPSFVGQSSSLLDIGMGSSITQAELGTGVRRGLVPNPYTNTLRANQLSGSKISPFIFKSEDDSIYSVVGGDTLANGANVLGQTGAAISDWIEFHHLIALGHTGVGSLTTATWTGKAGGSSLKLSDVILSTAQSPNFQVNGDGDAGTYNEIILDFVRSLGSPTLNEAFYIGDTSPSGYGVIATASVTNCLGYNKGWDGLQLNSIDQLYVSNVTIYNVGTGSESGQKSLLQAQNIGNGAIMENCLFWGAPKAFQIAARNITFNNCVWYADEEGFYQDVETQALYTASLGSAGGTVTFNNCGIYSSTPRSNGINIFENKANFVFNNCIFGTNITTPVLDSRSDTTTYSITQNNTTQAANPVTPTFNNFDYTDKDHGLVQESYYQNNSLGYRV